MGYAGSIKEYIYDCSNFAVDKSDPSYEALHDEYNDNDDYVDSSYSTSSDSMNIDDDELLDFGSTGPAKKTTEELLTIAEYIWSMCETDALGPEQKDIFIKMIVALLREWGW